MFIYFSTISNKLVFFSFSNEPIALVDSGSELSFINTVAQIIRI